MAKVTIDGVILDAANNKTIIEAARDNGISIPHFCWHPKLSVSGNCRICLVEVEKNPKLMIACATQVSEGMVVHTKNERVAEARNAVMEFLLINHPLDCPICDEAGECKLQDYTYRFSTGTGRFEEDKTHKPKRMPIGPRVMFDAERCILCSRCIRFCDEIVGTPQLHFVQRGDRTRIETFPGTELDNPYSMNVVDICPVGALTNRDFRFKARVWEMSFTESVCQGCSRGCNIDIGVRNNEILRLTPRRNDDVNGQWMCDYGRLETFKFVNADTRIKSPMMKREGKLIETSWDEAIALIGSELRSFKKSEIAFLGSAFATNEDNYSLAKFARDVIGTKNIDYIRHEDAGQDDALLMRADRTPNQTGASASGAVPSEGGLAFAGLASTIRAGKIKALYVIDEDLSLIPGFEEALRKVEFLVVHSSNMNGISQLADVVFPSSTFAEKNGTVTNFQRRVQRLRPAVTTIEKERALDRFEMSRWDKFSAHNDRWGKGPKRDCRPTWKIISAIAGLMGQRWKFNHAEDVFNEMCQKIESFKGLSYLKLGLNGAQLKSE